jgi:glycogen operon protein
MRRIWPGRPLPLGARWTGEGTNFSLFSAEAERVELCLFDDADRETRIPLETRTGPHWHAFLPEVGPGQRYGYRVSGPWDPAQGLRFNPDKLLIDPYAFAIEGPVDFEVASVLPYEPIGDDADLVRDGVDDADAIPKCVVVDAAFDWQGDRPPGTPWEDTIVYETHVRGFTALNERIRTDLRGTYAGLASEEATSYLTSLGVTAVELLPVHHFVDEMHLIESGLTNYWGYSSVGFMAPHAAYAATGRHGEQVREFKGMVKALHAAGLEVILDVVYNHTAEGNHLGPMLSFKGIDSRSYYHVSGEDPRFFWDVTGTGATVDLTHPEVLRLVMDSLRYWAVEMRVDGFRFDLAPALARDPTDFDPRSAFLKAVAQDPVLSRVKLIAEPWDVGMGGYVVGGFPDQWSEWNGRFRDSVRDFWRGEAGGVSELASRVTGSSDIFEPSGRRPQASVNFITAHDGFTLADLVSYDEKHNEANGEDNNDGTVDNRSWNMGAEGPTDDRRIVAARWRQQRNFLFTLLLSQGVPMLLGGDEMGRTQGGNNNAYCQDNEISWLDWSDHPRGEEHREFTRRLIGIRRAHPIFRRRDFFDGKHVGESGLRDVWWFRPDGREMSRRDWDRQDTRQLGMFLNGEEIPGASERGDLLIDHAFILLFNAAREPTTFRMPARRYGNRWRFIVSTDDPDAPEGASHHPARGLVEVPELSCVLLRRAW